jgi:hypothetical protein
MFRTKALVHPSYCSIDNLPLRFEMLSAALIGLGICSNTISRFEQSPTVYNYHVGFQRTVQRSNSGLGWGSGQSIISQILMTALKESWKGTTLEVLFEKDISHPLWSAKLIQDDSETIIQAHLAFLGAGARVILTST